MKRLRLYDIRLSRLPQAVGVCQVDMVNIARYANSAVQRLLYCREASDESWNGTFAEIVFNVSRDLPYITLPREIARLEAITVCNYPVYVQNQFYEYLRFGNGRLPKEPRCGQFNFISQCMTRNNVATFVDLKPAPQIVRFYATDAADYGKRVLLQGLDSNGNAIYSQDGLSQVQGIFLNFQTPFVDSPMQMNYISGLQKDITNGPVRVVQVDPVTGAEVLLSTMEGGEQTAWYRRYYIDTLPCGCCPTPNQTVCPTVQVTAIAKLEPIPMMVDTDYCLLQNLEAIIEEAQSVRYSEMDTAEAKQMSINQHIQAIRFLNGELSHYQGKNSPAVNFAPFGIARLERQKIGTLI